jgi:hypothetical protein
VPIEPTAIATSPTRETRNSRATSLGTARFQENAMTAEYRTSAATSENAASTCKARSQS